MLIWYRLATNHLHCSNVGTQSIKYNVSNLSFFSTSMRRKCMISKGVTVRWRKIGSQTRPYQYVNHSSPCTHFGLQSLPYWFICGRERIAKECIQKHMACNITIKLTKKVAQCWSRLNPAPTRKLGVKPFLWCRGHFQSSFINTLWFVGTPWIAIHIWLGQSYSTFVINSLKVILSLLLEHPKNMLDLAIMSWCRLIFPPFLKLFREQK